jgi:hypothetical protein
MLTENTPLTIQLSYKYYLILSMLIGSTAMMGLALDANCEKNTLYN